MSINESLLIQALVFNFYHYGGVGYGLNLEEIDSVKTIFVKAYTIDSLGVETPVEEVDVIISIEGMLSKMKIKEETIVIHGWDIKRLSPA